jgi:hypothetical protein
LIIDVIDGLIFHDPIVARNKLFQHFLDTFFQDAVRDGKEEGGIRVKVDGLTKDLYK